MNIPQKLLPHGGSFFYAPFLVKVYNLPPKKQWQNDWFFAILVYFCCPKAMNKWKLYEN